MPSQRETQLLEDTEVPVTASVRERRRRNLWQWLRSNNDDNLTTLLLALAALATSWAAYQASIWGGMQASFYTQANDTRTDALGATQEAARLRALDMALFMNWLTAYADGHTIVRQFYQSQFRPEFRPAFDRWIAHLRLTDTTNYSSPFEQPEYRVAAEARAQKLDEESTRFFHQGQTANDNSDGYVFDTVILAIVLFFASAARQIVSSRARTFIIGLSFVLLFWALVRITISPVAS